MPANQRELYYLNSHETREVKFAQYENENYPNYPVWYIDFRTDHGSNQ